MGAAQHTQTHERQQERALEREQEQTR